METQQIGANVYCGSRGVMQHLENQVLRDIKNDMPQADVPRHRLFHLAKLRHFSDKGKRQTKNSGQERNPPP